MVTKRFEEAVIWTCIGLIFVGTLMFVAFPELFEITGRVASGLVGLTVLDPVISISIVSPENTTYNFGIGDNYTIELNVTSDFEVNTWWYDLYDVQHSTYANQSVIFTPNTTINAVRWANILTVHANHTVGTETTDTVSFFVSVPNSAPVLGGINDSILVCENTTLSYQFNATDVDEDTISFDINPKDPFYVSPTVYYSQVNMYPRIISDTFSKSDIGVYEEIVSVSDQQYVDTKNVNITVIEINNPPVMTTIGAQTAWTSGDVTFVSQVNVTDVESGDQNSGNLSFVLTFLNGDKFFDISDVGLMYFVANASIIGVYNISVCVTDLALETISSDISYCGQDGLNQTTCQNFSLAVTDENRAPTITSYSPSELSLSTAGLSALSFSASKFDPDGNVPDGYWYIDGSLVETDIGSSTDTFSYTFGCGIYGAHTAEYVISDGALNDSVSWDISVTESACPEGAAAGAGGGGGGGAGAGVFCSTNWACKNWDVCQHSSTSLAFGLISGEDYRNVLESCSELGLTEDICGIQIRECNDLNSCHTNAGIPDTSQACYFVEHPNCFDKVKNCHDGECELLVDCGGSCKPCPTCSDRIQNQGEDGVDCGGPCPWKCVYKFPVSLISYILFGILLALLMIFAIYKAIRIIKLRRELYNRRKRK